MVESSLGQINSSVLILGKNQAFNAYQDNELWIFAFPCDQDTSGV